MNAKRVKVRKPYIYPNNSNFKLAVWNAGVESGIESTGDRLLENFYKSVAFHINLPTICTSKSEARLCFVEGATVLFDTFPDYLFHEVIPVIWDCWPSLWPKMEEFLIKHHVNTAFFTSSQTAEHFRVFFPVMNIFHLPEAIETNLYKEGKQLKDRKYDYLEFGRVCNYVDSSTLSEDVNVLSSKNESGALKTREMLIDALADSKITICLPRSVNQPEIAQGVETLTQRYWECMLSRVIIIGQAPKELIDIIGYDPVVHLDRERFAEQVQDILCNVEKYQELVDRNRQSALRLGDWKLRIASIRTRMGECGYEL